MSLTSDSLSRSSVFEADRLCYTYADGSPALTDISFSVLAGERIALLGANGSGKSTLIKVLDALLYPVSGMLRVFGEPLTESGMKNDEFAFRFRRRVGYVFQNAEAQLFSTTVREEIAFGPVQMGLPNAEVERRICDTAVLTGTMHLLDRAPFRLSGGEKRKVAIAACLAINPDVILMDEPSTGLDPRSQKWLINLMRQLSDAGKTLIVATHDLASVRDMADRALVIGEDHKLERDGAVAEIMADWSLLLGANLVHDHVHSHGGMVHSHPHFHGGEHQHSHDSQDSACVTPDNRHEPGS